LRLVLDANVYIFGLGSRREPACVHLLESLPTRGSGVSLRIPRLIVREVHRNLTPEAFHEFLRFLMLWTAIDEDEVVPFELGVKYERKGLKPADAFIAAYTEWVGAELLVSENRHFLSRHADLPFRVLPAEQAIRLIS